MALPTCNASFYQAQQCPSVSRGLPVPKTLQKGDGALEPSLRSLPARTLLGEVPANARTRSGGKMPRAASSR